MSKVIVVMRREFLSTVKRKSYLIVTFGMPFFAAIYIGLFTIPQILWETRSDRDEKPVAIVDLAGVVRLEEAMAAGEDPLKERVKSITGNLPSSGPSGKVARGILDSLTGTTEFRSYPSREEALEALEAGELERVYVIPEDYLATGAADQYQKDEITFNFKRKRGRP